MRRATAWIVLIGAVLAGAVLQGLTASPGLGLVDTGWFVALAVVSLLACIAEVVAVAAALRRLVAGDRPGLRPLLFTASALVFLGFVVGVLLPIGLVLVVAAGAFLLSAAAAGRENPFAGFVVFRRAPWRAALLVAAAVVLSAVSLVVAVATGFLLTGTIGGAAMWLWFGIAAALLLWPATRLFRRTSA